MYDQPIQRKINAYPKDFKPPEGYLKSKISAKYTYNEEFSFQPSYNQTNQSVKLFTQSKELADRKTFTLNPQQVLNKVDTEKEKPLINQHLIRKRPILNEQLLAKPRIVSKIDEDLHEIQQPEVDSMTPGSIKVNKVQDQKPLSVQKPFQVKDIKVQQISNRKIEDAHNSFKSYIKPNMFSNLSNREKKFPSLGRGEKSDIEGAQNLTKKFSNQKQFRQTNNMTFNLNRPESEEKLKSNKLLRFGYLFEENKVNKLKEEINFKAEEKSKNKKDPIKTQQSNKDFYEQSRLHLNNFRARKTMSSFKAYPQLGITSPQHPMQRVEEESNRKKITISYKTSLNNLKDISTLIKSGRTVGIEVKVPTILLKPKFHAGMGKQELYETAALVFNELSIPHSNLIVKRYSNCVLMISKNICILWHYNSKVYLGGWKNQYLDEGVRCGLGLEWVPNKYVYYGEYGNNKKNGFGVMKSFEETFVGFWDQGSKTQKGYKVQMDGRVYPVQEAPYQQSSRVYERDDFERDPFV